jgi:hypothetical protein
VIRFQCTCGKRLKVDDQHVGRKVKCGTCAKELIVPAMSQAGGADLDALAKAMGSAAPKPANGKPVAKVNGGPQAKNKQQGATNKLPLYIGLGVAGGVCLITLIVIAVIMGSGNDRPIQIKQTPVITPESTVKPKRAHTPGELFPNVEPQN